MDWLKKIIDSAEEIDEAKLTEKILKEANSVNALEKQNAESEDEDKRDSEGKNLVIAPGIFLKLEGDGKVLIQNPTSEGAVEFQKDVLLLIYDFYASENPEGKPVEEFLQHWPTESHEELKKQINLLIASEILIDIGQIKTSNDDLDTPQAPTPEKNIHINLINHHYMLKDYVRVAAYRRAIENKVKSGSIAMDLGTGTGILAFIAAKAGAKKVYAIEKRSDIVNLSRELAKENSIEDRLEYLIGNSSKICETQLEEKVDVFISEILGSGIFEENVIEYTMDARDRFCKPDATLIPCKIDVHAFGYDAGRQDDIIAEASEIERMYDVKLSKYKENIINFVQSRYERFNTSIYKVMTDQLKTASVELKTIQNSMFNEKLELTAKEDGYINAFCAYFVAHLDEKTTLTNSPWAPSTHWIQKVFVMPASLKVTKGQKIPITSIYDGDYRIELRID